MDEGKFQPYQNQQMGIGRKKLYNDIWPDQLSKMNMIQLVKIK